MTFAERRQTRGLRDGKQEGHPEPWGGLPDFTALSL